MFKTMAIAIAVPAFAVALSAQTKITGSLQCAKPEVNHAVPVGDQPDHVFVLTQNKCTWTKPFEIAGAQSKDDLGSGIADVRGNNSQDRGYDVTTTSNGDKIFVRNQGTSKVKGEILESGNGTWSFTGGTGKLQS
jgi:hypothetical protein